MILRLPNSRSRALVVLAALLVALWLSSFGMRSAIARYGAEGESLKRLELAVRLEPSNPDYWYRLGRYQQYNLDNPNSTLAENAYRKAIALNPLATNAWLDLATAYELEGKSIEARKAYLEAKKSYPTSGDVAWRYGNFLLRQGQLDEAYMEMRRAIAADPHLAASAFSRAYRADPDIDRIMEKLLPPQQAAYVEMINEAVSEQQLAVSQTLWSRLLFLHPRLTMRDFERLVAGLLSSGDDGEARRAWDQGVATMNLPALLEPQGSLVWDPSFESGIAGYSFAWQFKPIVQGVSIGLDREEKHSGAQSLRLSFDGEHNPDLEAACTLTVVRPATTYGFSGWMKTKNITTEFGVGFRLHLEGASGGSIVDTKQLYGTNAFTRIDQTLTTGPDTRRVEICVIREASDKPGLRISGTAWVDDVNLVPEPAERSKP